MTQTILHLITNQVIKQANFRVSLARESHFWFFHSYFPHYITYPTADFHRDMFQLTEQTNQGINVIVAFRGSSKSTICTLSYPIWAILGKQQRKFIVILGQTQRQAKQHLMNIKKELETNALLKRDLGPFHEESDEWGGYSLVLPRYGARITAASSEQGIRGIRHNQYRPDVIIADDIEDLDTVRTQERRNKIYNWFKGDVLPAGTTETKVIVVGNLLHEDSLLRRLQGEIELGDLKGVFREYPLITDQGITLWPERYPDDEAIQALKQTCGNENAWQREFMLNIIPESDQVVNRDWIQYYDNEELPSFQFDKFSWTKIGIDLAISLKSSADYTAMVVGSLFGEYSTPQLYIHPFPVNERLDFPTTLERAKILSDTANPRRKCELLVEEVAYQAALVQQLKKDGYRTRGIKVTMDKRSRLALVTKLIKDGTILFPKKGAELLVNQLVGFGVEKHDDLVDAFVILATHVAEKLRAPIPILLERPDRI